MERSSSLVVLPIDTTRRDLTSRLILGQRLVSAGFVVFIGYPDEAYAVAIRNESALYLGRFGTIGGCEQDFKFLDALAAARGKMLYLHDEGAFYYRGHYEQYLKMLHPVRLLSHDAVSSVCCWGNKQAQAVSAIDPELSKKVRVTGMYRFSTLRSNFNSSGENGKPIILLMGRYSEANTSPLDVRPFSDDSFEMYNRAGFSSAAPVEVVEDMRRSWRKSVREWAAFLDLIEHLSAELKSYEIVIRPHPAEDWSIYKKCFADLSNVSLDHIENVHESISRAACVIHTECTTGVEALLMGKRVVSFRPHAGLDPDYEIVGASSAGIPAGNPAEVVNIVRGTTSFGQHSLDGEISDLLADCIDNFDSLKVIVQAVCEESEGPHAGGEDNYVAHSMLDPYYLRLKFRSFVRFMRGRLLSQDKLISQHPEVSKLPPEALDVSGGGLWMRR